MNHVESNIAGRYVLVLALFAALVFYVCLGLVRFIDGDEGFYLYATKLFVAGEKPYLDFFYPQMPAFLYVYSAIGKLFGNGWYVYRALGALLATLCVSVVVFYSYYRLKSLSVSLLLLGLFAFSGLSVGWLVVAKTYGLSTLILTISVVLFLYYLDSKNKYYLFVSALALGFLASTRLMLIGIAPVYVLFIWCNRETLRGRLAMVSLFLAGVLLGSCLLFVYIFQDWLAFWFNNLGYHGIRSGEGFVGDFDQKVAVLKELLGVRANHGYYFGIQNLVLILALWHLRRCFDSIRAKFLALLLVCLIGISLMPTPTFTQYFAVLIPVVLLLLFELIYSGSSTRTNFYNKKYILILFVIYATVFPFEVYRYTISGNKVPGVVEASEWKIESVSKISGWLNSNVESGASIISFWPGFLLESKLAGLPGSENHFGWQVVDKLSDAEAEHYHLMTNHQLSNLLKIRQPDFLILNMWTMNRNVVESQLSQNGYSVAFQMDGIGIWASSNVNFD